VFDGAALEYCAECVDPFSFDAIGKHFVLFFRRQAEDFTPIEMIACQRNARLASISPG
jgi:hypothetical protein